MSDNREEKITKLTIHEAIPKIMDQIGVVGKNKKNTQPGQQYAFRGIDDVMQAAQKVLAENKVFFVPEVLETTREERQSNSGGRLMYTVLKIKFTFFASDGSSVSCTTMGEAMDSGDKSCNKAMSAALKYALTQTFCIPTEEAKDTENDSPEVKPRVQAWDRPTPVLPAPNTSVVTVTPVSAAYGPDAVKQAISNAKGPVEQRLVAPKDVKVPYSKGPLVGLTVGELSSDQLVGAIDFLSKGGTKEPSSNMKQFYDACVTVFNEIKNSNIGMGPKFDDGDIK